MAVELCLPRHGFKELADYDLVAAPVIGAETLSTPHETQWRGETPSEMADLGRTRYRAMPIRVEQPAGLSDEAWRIAEEFGWAKTYDALYVALARLLECRLVTVDMRPRRGTERLTPFGGTGGFVVTPQEL